MPFSVCSKNSHPRGFTLIELLVVISIIALLIAILLPALKSARATARTVICLTKIRTTAVATELYRNDFKLWFPPDALVTNKYWPAASSFYRYETLMAPYIGSSEETFTMSAAKNPWMCTENPYQPGQPGGVTTIRLTGYSGGTGNRGNFYTTRFFGWDANTTNRKPINQIKAPTSEVILNLEVKGLYFNWTDVDASLGSFLHQGDVNLFQLADGHAKASKAVSATELAADNMRVNPN